MAPKPEQHSKRDSIGIATASSASQDSSHAWMCVEHATTHNFRQLATFTGGKPYLSASVTNTLRWQMKRRQLSRTK